MDSSLEIISKLKFIGKLKPGDKIDTKSFYALQGNTWYTSIYRAIVQDSRAQTLLFLLSTINKSFEILTQYIVSSKESERVVAENIIQDLKDGLNGLTSLQETYSTDVYFCCETETLKQRINSKLSELKYSKPDAQLCPVDVILPKRKSILPVETKSSSEDLRTSSDDLKSSSNDLKSSKEDLKSSSNDLKSSKDDLKANKDELKPSKDTIKTSIVKK